MEHGHVATAATSVNTSILTLLSIGNHHRSAAGTCCIVRLTETQLPPTPCLLNSFPVLFCRHCERWYPSSRLPRAGQTLTNSISILRALQHEEVLRVAQLYICASCAWYVDGE